VSELVLAVYDSPDTAEHVLGVLRARPDELPLDLSSAATVRVGDDGEYTVITTDRPGTRSALWGVLWEALFALVFIVPTPGTTYGFNLAGLFGAIDQMGLGEDFRADVRSALGHRCSGLVFLATDWDAGLVLHQLYLRPDSLVQVSLSPEQVGALVSELGGGPSGDWATSRRS
jgi:uncharacterized membrane protein